MTWHPWIRPPELCPCLYSAVALTTEVALVRWWEAAEPGLASPYRLSLPLTNNTL